MESISDGAFAQCSHLSHVAIEDGVKEIGDCVFFMCYDLTSVVIPNSVRSIGRQDVFGLDFRKLGTVYTDNAVAIKYCDDRGIKHLPLKQAKQTVSESMDLHKRYDDVVNAELSAMNKFLDEFGFEVELQDNWKYGNYAGMFLNSIQDDASVFPIALNKKLIIKGSEDFTDLIYNIRGTLAHEVGHGLFEYLNDIVDLDDLDEEDVVEDFAYCYEDRCLDDSELYRILTNLDNFVDEKLIHKFNTAVKTLSESNIGGQRFVKEVLCDMLNLAGCAITKEDARKYILHHRDLNKYNYSINNLVLIPAGTANYNNDIVKDIHSKIHSIYRAKRSQSGSYDKDAHEYMSSFKIINVYASILHGQLVYVEDPRQLNIEDGIVVEASTVDKIKLTQEQDRRRKLSDEDKEEIRRLYATGFHSLNSLAKQFGVSKKLILLIVNPESKAKNDERIKNHWRDYYDTQEHTSAMRDTRAYKKDLLDRGELKTVDEDLEDSIVHKNYNEFMTLLKKSAIDNSRFNIEQFKKYSNDNGEFICLIENGKLMSAAYIKENTLGINDTYINEVQTLQRGYGKKLINEIIKSNNNVWLMAEPDNSELVNYYKQFGLDEIVIPKSDSIYDVDTHCFYKFNNKKDANKIREYFGKNNLTEDIEEEMSNEYDSEGNQLTKAQAEFFKNSKIRDEQGRLLVVYHGTDKNFDEFNRDFIGSTTHNMGLFGSGFYFTNVKDTADYYSHFNKLDGDIKVVYLNIQNPFMWNEYKTQSDYKRIVKKLRLGGIVEWSRGYSPYAIHVITNDASSREFTQRLISCGYDGVIFNYGNDELEIVAFEPNQIKSITNLNPTNKDNINESLITEAKADQDRFKAWLNNDLSFDEANACFDTFTRLKSRIKTPYSDMYWWMKNSNPEDFSKYIDNLVNEVEDKRDVKRKEQSGARLVYQDKDWKVYEITNYEASAKYGKGTKWCIAGSKRWDNGESGAKYFNNYYSQKGIKFYYFIKGNEKYALVLYPDKETFEIYNAEDVQVAYIPDAPVIDEIGVNYYEKNDMNILINAMVNRKVRERATIRAIEYLIYDDSDGVYLEVHDPDYMAVYAKEYSVDGYYEYQAVKAGEMTPEEYEEITGEEFNDEWGWGGDIPPMASAIDFPLSFRTTKESIDPDSYREYPYWVIVDTDLESNIEGCQDWIELLNTCAYYSGWKTKEFLQKVAEQLIEDIKDGKISISSIKNIGLSQEFLDSLKK